MGSKVPKVMGSKVPDSKSLRNQGPEERCEGTRPSTHAEEARSSDTASRETRSRKQVSRVKAPTHRREHRESRSRKKRENTVPESNYIGTQEEKGKKSESYGGRGQGPTRSA